MESKNKRDDKYIQFPLSLLQETFQDPYGGLNTILCYGIVNYAKTFKYDIKEVARQLIYAFHRNKKMIQSDLYDTLTEFIKDGFLYIDEDYNGFFDDSFNPEESIKDLLNIFKAYEGIEDDAIFRYQIEQADKLLNIKCHSIDSTINNYNTGLTIQNNFEQVYGNDCNPMVKPSQVIAFRESGKDLDLFRAYIGIRSIIGQKNFEITHKSVILCRMIGCKSNESLQEFIKRDTNAKEIYDKYSKRYWMDWMLSELEMRGFITKISYPKWGIFVSTKIRDKELLAKTINEKKTRHQLKAKEKIARTMIQQHIYNATL